VTIADIAVLPTVIPVQFGSAFAQRSPGSGFTHSFKYLYLMNPPNRYISLVANQWPNHLHQKHISIVRTFGKK